MVSVDVPSTPSASASAFSFSITISVCSPFAFVELCIVFVLSPVSSFMPCLFVHCVKFRMSSTCFPCLHAVIHHGSCARSFDFLRFCFSIFTFCLCCCILNFLLVLLHLRFLLALLFFCGGGFSLDFFNNLLVSQQSQGHFDRSFCSNVVFLYCFLDVLHSFLMESFFCVH